MDPGRARIGDDDSGRAEDRQAAKDAEPAVGGALRDFFAAGHGDFDDRVGARAEPCGHFFQIGADHRARGGIDRGLTHWQGQARSGHGAHAFAGSESYTRAGRRETDGRYDQRAMGDVGIVTRVLDDPGAGEIRAKLLRGEDEFRPETLWQRDGNRIGKLAGEQRFERGAGRARCTGACRPAALERRPAFGLGHGPWRSAHRPLCLVPYQ